MKVTLSEADAEQWLASMLDQQAVHIGRVKLLSRCCMNRCIRTARSKSSRLPRCLPSSSASRSRSYSRVSSCQLSRRTAPVLQRSASNRCHPR